MYDRCDHHRNTIAFQRHPTKTEFDFDFVVRLVWMFAFSIYRLAWYISLVVQLLLPIRWGFTQFMKAFIINLMKQKKIKEMYTKRDKSNQSCFRFVAHFTLSTSSLTLSLYFISTSFNCFAIGHRAFYWCQYRLHFWYFLQHQLKVMRNLQC